MVRADGVSPTPLCQDCGTQLSYGPWVDGLCPHCLLELALTESSAVAEELDDPETLPTLEYASETLAPGQILGQRYQIRSLLGRGGMGEVWRAYDLKLRVDVALKALRVELLADKRALELLRREVRAAREVISPNVCRVFDLVELDGQELVSMEYIDGTTLLEIVRSRGPLELEEAREIASQFLVGLEAIHHAGLVHRDLKPENVMTTLSGRVVVMDFGIAKALADRKTGTVAGTPAYMAPEQMRGETVDARADVFSAGVVLAEMIAPDGVRDREAREAIWRGLHRSPAELADTPWASVLAKAVAQQPEQRFASASVLARALEEVTLRVEGAEDVEPYPGLASFTQEDAEYFFGRELEVEAMWKKLRRPHLLALIGPSGAGKSSFLRAGLISTIPSGWQQVMATPGNQPFMALASVLAEELTGDSEAVQQLLHFDDPDVAVALVSRWRRQHKHTLLIVDQFEELFTLNSPEVQERFTELLGRLALEADVHVLLSMRDDFLFHCYPHESLRPLLSELTLLGAPTGAALRRAVVQPALKCGYRFEDEELVEEILTEVEGERGALPMLAFAAARLWDTRDRDRGLLTREAYEYLGGVGGALAQHAEATLEQIGSGRIPIVRELFRNLVTAQGTRAARDREELLSVFGTDVGAPLVGARAGTSPAPTSEGASGGVIPPTTGAAGDRDAAAQVLDTLIDARLLTSYELPAAEGEETGRHRIEIIHESLLSAWPRLVRWQTQDTDSAQLRDQLRQAAQLWQERQRSDDLLWTGTAFREFQLWRERYPGGLSGTEEAFGQAMTGHAERRTKLRRLAAAGAFALLLVVLGVVGFYWRQSDISRRRAEAETLRAEASKLVALAQVQLQTDPTEALAYTIGSLELTDTPAARSFSMRVLWEAPPAMVLDYPFSNAEVVRFSTEGGWVAVSGFSNLAAVWSETGDGPIMLGGLDATTRCMNSGRWISESQLVLGLCPASLMSERVRIWSIPEGRLLRTLELGAKSAWQVAGNRLFVRTARSEPSQAIDRLLLRSWRLPGDEPEDLGWIDWQALGASTAVFDPSGKALIYTKDRTIYARPLPIAAGGRDRVVGAHDADRVQLVIYALKGDQLVSIDSDRELRVWSLSAPGTGPLRVISRPEGATASSFLFPDSTGRWVYRERGSQQIGKGLLWDLGALPGAQPLELRRSGSWSFSNSNFHPNGDWLAATTRVGSETTFWPLRRAYPSIVTGASARRKGLAFSPDGQWLATTWPPGRAKILPLPHTDRKQVPDLGEHPFFSNLFFDPTGRRLMGGHYGHRLSVVPLDGGEARRLEGFPSETIVESLAFSPSGRLVAAASSLSHDENKLRVWNLDTGETKTFDLPRNENGTSAELGTDSSADEDAEPAVTGYENNVQNLWFTDEETLFTVGASGFLRWNLNNGSSDEVAALGVAGFRTAVASADGQKVLIMEVADGTEDVCDIPELFDLATGASEVLPSFGDCVRTMALDPGGTVAVTGDAEGVIRVGRVAGGEPHLLAGHEGAIEYVAVSPDLRWVASAGSDGTLRLWPMPDLEKPPLHTLPLEELLAKLRSLTNLRAVQDPDFSTGWRIEIGPFPGWKEVPTW